MTTQPLIAIITPIYNGVDFIKSAVDTVKEQTASNIRHYIYDDASSDGTTDALNDLTIDPSLRIVFGKSNQGQAHGRNVLLKQAIEDGCDFVAFLDMDDTWNPDHLESSLNALDDSDIVYSKPHFVFENGETAVQYNIPIPNVFIGKQLRHNNFIWISSVVAKIDTFKGVEFDNNLNSVEDWDMWLQQFNLGRKFAVKAETSVTYLIRPNGSAGQSQGKQELLFRKHPKLEKLKLHLACGHDYQQDYINVDLYPVEGVVTDARFDVAKLPYEDNSVDEIRAFHIIEHFDWHQGQRTLEEWNRVLKPGGRLWLETPDFLASCDAFVKGSPDFRNMLYGHFFAMPWIPGQTHKFLFTEDQLRIQLEWAGFKNTVRRPPASGYVLPETWHLFLNVETFK